MPSISIIICTRNRADSLRETLASIGRCEVSPELPAELIVVDNGSSDHTAEVVKSASLKNMPVRYLLEPRLGVSYARNRGMAEAAGSIFLWTDDDVRVPADWIPRMCDPILRRQTEGVAGGVRLAPHLDPEWLVGDVRGWLASTDVMLIAETCEGMIGANMAFSRAVLQKVPPFDPELGGGGLGSHEESLFARQMLKAGYRIVPLPHVAVEHHFDPARLSYEGLTESARKIGRSTAYLLHHWEHRRVRLPRIRLACCRLLLGCDLLLHGAVTRRNGQEIPRLGRLYRICAASLLQQYLVERRRPRNYEKHGLVRRDA